MSGTYSDSNRHRMHEMNDTIRTGVKLKTPKSEDAETNKQLTLEKQLKTAELEASIETGDDYNDWLNQQIYAELLIKAENQITAAAQ